jgi:hypothetical protein
LAICIAELISPALTATDLANRIGTAYPVAALGSALGDALAGLVAFLSRSAVAATELADRIGTAVPVATLGCAFGNTLT